MAQHPRLDLHVAYCSLRGAQPVHDPDFNATVQWDVPLLEGYSWEEIPNRGSGAESFFGLRNPGLGKLIRNGNFDAVFCFLSYLCASFWISYFACKLSQTAFLFGTDATTLTPVDGHQWKRPVKGAIWPIVFRLADQVIVPSNGTRELMLSLGIREERVTLTPYAVDNEWWMAQSTKVDRAAVRSSWGANAETAVVLFCAKLQPWKRPLDLLLAFANANVENSLLVFAGDGPLRQSLQAEAAKLGVAERVRFLGFINQSKLPAIYTASDLMVLPSEYDAFGVVVNEAMLCGCLVAASNHVGAARDLIVPVSPDLVYPCGDVGALAGVLRRMLVDRSRSQELQQRARERMETWSPTQNIAGVVEAARCAVKHRRDS
jgi:glycosyltransferase involved in cell wall biosynthesis